MTKKELNSAVNKLKNNYLKLNNSLLFATNNKLYYEELEKLGVELKRLYYVDDNFEYCTKKSVLILYRMNLRLRIIPLHTFGLNIEISKL